jgi:hypothetical protein
LEGYVACIGQIRNAYKMLENIKRRDNLEDLGVDGKILKLYFRESV